MPRSLKRLFIIVLCVLLALVLAVGAYVAYVLLSYHRLEDNLPLEVERSAADSGAPAVGTPYRLASYNIGFGAYSDDYSFFMDGGTESRARSEQAVYDNVGGAMAAVQELAPDFLVIQEVDTDGTRSYHVDESAFITETLAAQFPQQVFAQNYDSPYLLWPLTEPHGANQAGQMTLSKFNISSALRRSLPIEGGFMKFLDLDRCYSVARIPLEGGGELVLYNLHLSAYTSDGTIADEQLKMLFADMVREYAQGNWTIAGGDFNKDLLGNSPEIFGVSGPEYTWAQPIPDSIIPQGFSIAAPFDQSAPVASCRNADRPYGPDSFLVTVDGFIVSDNVTVTACRVLDTGFRWSDHNPVYLDFILEEETP